MKETPVSSRCAEILESREHVLLGISPLNSYYSEEKINELLCWARDNFKSFHVLTSDTIFKQNFLALGYDEKKATAKTRLNWNALRNKILRAFSNIGYNEQECQEKIIALSGKLPDGSLFNAIREACTKRYKHDLEFKQKCLSSSKEVIKNYSADVNDAMLEVAAVYLLEEMPFYLDTPSMLDVPTSLMVYHKAIPFFTDLYKDRAEYLVSNNQGHLILA